MVCSQHPAIAQAYEHRPHRSLNQQPSLVPVPPVEEGDAGAVIALDRLRRCNRLGGLIHEYHLAA